MIESLRRHSSEATRISVLTMDDECQHALYPMALESNYSLCLVPIKNVEKKLGLTDLRQTRTHQEFCWSCGAIFTDYLMKYSDELTYIDADCFFFSDPEPVFAEIGDKSIAITPHRFAKKDEARLLPNGKYAVQWVTFRGEVGRRCLSKWAGQVRDWCFYRHEDGKFADQKFLDSWCDDYPGEVCEIQHPGVGLAPWNIGRYVISEGPKVDAWPVILFHAHEYLHGKRLTNWKLRPEDIALIYEPYSAAIERNTLMLESLKVEAQRA